jgi:hypothetical protein
VTDSVQADHGRPLPFARHGETNAIDQDFERARGNAGLIATERTGRSNRFCLLIDIG